MYIFKNIEELKEILDLIKSDLSDSKKIEAIKLASGIIDDWSFYLNFVGKKMPQKMLSILFMMMGMLIIIDWLNSLKLIKNIDA